MLQVLFAINKTHWLNEKGALAIADTFGLKPERLQSRINKVFQLLEANPQPIQNALFQLDELNREIAKLDAGS